MAEEKYAKAKCFILSPEGYQEISYLELSAGEIWSRTIKTGNSSPCMGC